VDRILRERISFAHCQVENRDALFSICTCKLPLFSVRLCFFRWQAVAVSNLELLLQKLTFCTRTERAVCVWKKCCAELLLLLQIDLCLTIQPELLAFGEKDDSVAKFQPFQANIAITIIIPGIKNNSTAVAAAAAGHNNNKKTKSGTVLRLRICTVMQTVYKIMLLWSQIDLGFSRKNNFAPQPVVLFSCQNKLESYQKCFSQREKNRKKKNRIEISDGPKKYMISAII